MLDESSSMDARITRNHFSPCTFVARAKYSDFLKVKETARSPHDRVSSSAVTGDRSE
jgi:hypothetical protein